MQHRPRHRLATDLSLKKNTRIELEGNAAHYLTHVLRLKEGEKIALFNREDGEWVAKLDSIRRRALTLVVEEHMRSAAKSLDLWVAFAPIKGGRLETIIEKATELGASVLQPVITQRTIVDKVNLDRAESIAREAAEQSERTDWPEIREPLKLTSFFSDWPSDRPLLYGDESGASQPVSEVLKKLTPAGAARWGVLSGPEGGFTAAELAGLRHLQAGHGVSLGPRILRADTAIITLCALTAAAWGDWDNRPRFEASKKESS